MVEGFFLQRHFRLTTADVTMNVVYCRNGYYIASYNRTAQSWQGVLIRVAEEERDDAPHKAKFCGICGAANLVTCEHSQYRTSTSAVPTPDHKLWHLRLHAGVRLTPMNAQQ